MTAMTRPPALVCALLLAAAPAAPAAADAARDAAFLSSCMDAAMPGGTAAVESRCIGLLAIPCGKAPGGETSAGAVACVSREEQAWGALLDADWMRLRARVKAAAAAPDAPDRLLGAQRAWAAFRDAECAYAAALWGADPMGRIAAAECRRDAAARRAIQLRAQLIEEN